MAASCQTGGVPPEQREVINHSWGELAKRLPAYTLQLRISDALQAHPRGYEPLPPGENASGVPF